MPDSQQHGKASGPDRILVAALSDLHLQAGKPSARAISRTLGTVSHTTVAEALSGRRLPSWPVLARIVKVLGGDEESFRQIWTDVEYQRGALASPSERSARTVFVISGRDSSVRSAMFDFLRALDLRPLEWDSLISATRQAAPTISTVIRTAISKAQAIVVLLTPDDLVNSGTSGSQVDSGARQPNPNVLIELGMALMAYPERTIIVLSGELRPITDLAGLNYIRLDGSASGSHRLADRLKIAGCIVDDSGGDWLRMGARLVDIDHGRSNA